jgi:IclR family pca regulon transcriptional regulator
LNPAVVRRCLNTLVHLGYVAQNGRRFHLRPEVMIFASAFLASSRIEELVRPHLEEVRDETGDSASMATLSGQDIVYLVHVPANRLTRVASIGTRLPASETAMGLILLAFANRDAHLLQEADLAEESDTAKQSGHAVVRNEMDSGITSIAVPIKRPDGRVFAAINCASAEQPSSPSAFVSSRLPALNAARERIEAQLELYPLLAQATF